jgi:hypothetical protein
MWHIAVQQKERKQLFLFNYFTPGIPKEPKFIPYPLHIPPILPAHVKQRRGDLPERAATHRVHQHREQVFVVDGRLFQPDFYSLPNYNLYNAINSFFVWVSNMLRNSIASQLGLVTGVSS